mmetsp:Transcript_17489/g.49406  ORF Transcript_17489/g.49406 Transcript_17489/m.49406 type:complete len:100 (-) Transcript_17489:316-615(-)
MQGSINLQISKDTLCFLFSGRHAKILTGDFIRRHLEVAAIDAVFGIARITSRRLGAANVADLVAGVVGNGHNVATAIQVITEFVTNLRSHARTVADRNQ